jgi:FkbM family methyltransferase
MPFRAIGRGLRRLVLPLVGFWDLLRRLEELHAEVAASRTLLDRIEARFAAADAKLDQLATVRPSLDRAAARFETEAEWARVRHELATGRHDAAFGRFDDLTQRIAHGFARMEAEQARQRDTWEHGLTSRNGPLATTVAAEIDRLDGYLVHHAATLRGSVEALGNGQRPALAYAGQGLDALVMAAEFDLVVPTAEEGLLLYIMRHGVDALEPGVRALLRRRLKPGAVAVDAGANIGIHSLAMAAAVGPEGRVFCFEPLPHLASALERSLRLNGFADRARVERTALADRPGEATFHRAAHSPMSSLFALPSVAAGDELQVAVTTLDACLPAGSRVDFVKMDVEGAEPRAWRGMERVIADNPGIEIVLEWSASHFRRSGEDPNAFMAAIQAVGFNAFLVDEGEGPGPLAPVGDPAALEGTNLLLTRASAFEKAGAR